VHSLNFSGWALRNFALINFLGDVQGLQRESADRLAAKHRAEKELATVQEANKGLQAVAAKAEEARQGLVPAGELAAAQSALSSAEQRIADLERELREAKEEASSADGRAKAAITAAEEDRKVSDALVAGIQDDHTSLQRFITDLARPLIGKCICLCQ
jgi:chromosome segregation ATPase